MENIRAIKILVSSGSTEVGKILMCDDHVNVLEDNKYFDTKIVKLHELNELVYDDLIHP